MRCFRVGDARSTRAPPRTLLERSGTAPAPQAPLPLTPEPVRLGAVSPGRHQTSRKVQQTARGLPRCRPPERNGVFTHTLPLMHRLRGQLPAPGGRGCWSRRGIGPAPPPPALAAPGARAGPAPWWPPTEPASAQYRRSPVRAHEDAAGHLPPHLAPGFCLESPYRLRDRSYPVPVHLGTSTPPPAPSRGGRGQGPRAWRTTRRSSAGCRSAPTAPCGGEEEEAVGLGGIGGVTRTHVPASGPEETRPRRSRRSAFVPLTSISKLS